MANPSAMFPIRTRSIDWISTKRTEDGLPVHSFRSLRTDLATLTRNNVRFGKGQTVTILATPTPEQDRAFLLLGVTPKAEM